LVLVAATVFSQNLTYISVKEVSSTNKVAVADMDDFLKIIKEHKVKNVLVSRSLFVVQVESILYTIESARFETIEDYREGRKVFGDGDTYYLAMKNGLKTREEADYFRNEQFVSGEDYAKARKAGFVGNTIAPRPTVVRGLLRKSDFQKNIYFANALFSITHFKPNEKTEKEGILKNTDIKYLVTLANGAIKPLGDDLYYLNLKTDNAASVLAAKVNTIFKKKGDSKDALVYYMAMLSRYKSADEYRAAIDAGDVVIAGTAELCSSAGFKTLEQAEAAITAGFSDGRVYGLALDYGLKTGAEYDAAKDRIAGYEKLKKTYQLKTKIEAFVVEKMLALPQGVPVSLERFAEQYNAAIAEDAFLDQSSYKINETFLATLFTTTPPLASFFSYDAAGKNFQRK
jgi:hypothetical protein